MATVAEIRRRVLEDPLGLVEVEVDGRWLAAREVDARARVAVESSVGADGDAVLRCRPGDGAEPTRVRFPVLAELTVPAGARAALALHQPDFPGFRASGGRTDGAVFLPGRPRVGLWRSHFFPTGTWLHGPDGFVGLGRYDEALAEAYVRGGPLGAAFPLTGGLELTAGEWEGGWRAWLGRVRTRFVEGLDLSLYRREDLRWMQRCYVAGYMMAFEHDFYDEERGGYRYGDWFARAERELGNFDLILFCQGSPRIGIDDRNLHDLHRDVPGGFAALRAFVEEAHRHGSRVVYDYRPWDTCTRHGRYPDEHREDMVELLRETGMDGVFVDTGAFVPPGFRAAADALRPGVGFTSEFPPPTRRDLEEHVSSWAQQPPGEHNEPVLFVDGLKYLLPLHNVHLANRWSRNHRRLIAHALFNGQGFYVWEPYYGAWNRWGPSARAVAKRAGQILRANWDAFNSLDWQPLVETLHPGVYANRWPAADRELVTLLAMADVPAGAPVIELPHTPGARYVDLWNQREIVPEIGDGRARLTVPLELDVPACVGVFRPDADPARHTPLDGPAAGSFAPRDPVERDGTENFLATSRLISRVDRVVGRADQPAGDMAPVPGGLYRMVVASCDKPHEYSCYHADGNHERHVELGPYLIDRTPVTNRQFKAFLDATAYRPADPTRFLAHWSDGAYPPAKADHPVVYVAYQDALAYAAWAGKRLPTEAEWQFAAQGHDRRRWPWGNAYEPWRCAGDGPDTAPVDRHPDGASPFGVLDLCGNVWELTADRRDDGHHYYLILKGGAHYKVDERGLEQHHAIYERVWPPFARGRDGRIRLHFYRRGGAQPVDHHLRFLQMGAALDRGATVGFRCVRDL